MGHPRSRPARRQPLRLRLRHPVEPDIWAVFDPVAGRIVIQKPPPPSPSSTAEEVKGEGTGEREDKEKGGVKGKGSASASGEKGQTGRPSVAAARKSATKKGKGGKGSALYECINCGEVHLQWWGTCRHCKAAGTFQKLRDMVLQGDGDPSEEGEEEEGDGAGEREDEEEAGVKGKGKWKRKRKREGQGIASGEKSQTSRRSGATVRKSAGSGGKERVSYVCSHCGEGYRQWWGCCRHCNVLGTNQRSSEMVP